MNEDIKPLLIMLGGRLLDYGVARLSAPSRSPVEERIQHIGRLIQAIPTGHGGTSPSPARATESQKTGHQTENPSAYKRRRYGSGTKV